MREIEPIPTIEPGDLIQLASWFGDAWAEVVTAHEPNERGQMFTYVRREKYGERLRDELHLGNREGYAGLRRVAKPADVDIFTNNISLAKWRIRCGEIWDAGERIGRIVRNPWSIRRRVIAAETGSTVLMAEDFLIRPFCVEVRGYDACTMFAATRGRAQARAWHDYATNHPVPYREFLRISRVTNAPAPDRFGEAILVNGHPAYLVERSTHRVRYARPGLTEIGNVHPGDVEWLDDEREKAA